jgi:alpha-tubulin suppressor-like RCC1 family protein
VQRPDAGSLQEGGTHDGAEPDPNEEPIDDAEVEPSGPELEAGEGELDAGHDAGDDESNCERTKSCRRATHIAYGAPACAILDDGTLWCWGGVHGPRLPKQVGTDSDWDVVSTTANVNEETGNQTPGNHTCGIRSGALYCWGENNAGQLGIGSAQPSLAPEPLRVGEGSDWSGVSTSALSIGGAVTCGIRAGALYCWGSHTNATKATTTPLRVGTRDDWTSVSADVRTSCGIAGGSAYCWTMLGGDSIEKSINEWSDWTHVAGASDYTCGIRSGRLFCWGYNLYGQLGLGIEAAGVGKWVEAPTQVGVAEDWTFVDASASQACGIRDGELYCWGATRVRDLRATDLYDGLNPVPKRVEDTGEWVAVDVGLYGACAVRANGEVGCWGLNARGELGTESVPMAVADEPTQVGEADDWLDIAAGSSSTCGLRLGQLFCWGTMRSHVDGHGTVISQTFSPQRVGSANNWSLVSMNFRSDHACALQREASSSIWCWGDGHEGQLGTGQGAAPSSDPVPLAKSTAPRGWEDLATGPDSACGLDFDGLSCWGHDWSGITRVSKSEDVRGGWEIIGTSMGIYGGRLVEWTSASSIMLSTVSTQAGWTALARGEDHTCGIRNGELYCWGQNARSQLGLGVARINTTQLVPQLVTNPSTSPWISVAARDSATCGLRSDKTLWCWGGSPSWSSDPSITLEPKQVPGLWESVALGGTHTCAIASNGTLWCWGPSRDGECGLGEYWNYEMQWVKFPQTP